MTDIQRARDVLAKWRKDAEDGPWKFADEGKFTWTVRTDQPPLDLYGDPYDDNVGELDGYHDARLIVGTAGNPGLLDAIDGLLELAEAVARDHRAGWGAVVWGKAEPIAAAIIAADERMSA